MKKLFIKFFFLLPLIITFSFFVPNLIHGKIPIPADSLIGLYNPWRDETIAGYSPGKVPVKNPLITDPILQTYPWRKLVINNIKLGLFPLWNPYSFSGQPLLANIQSSPFQFLNVLFFLTPFKFTWITQIILATILTSFFMFIFLKSLKLSNISSLFGSLVLPFSGFFVAWQTWDTVVTTAMYLPLILFLINKIFEKVKLIWFLLLILAASQAILSGHWQTAFYVFSASIAYLIYRQITSKKSVSFVTICLAIALSILVTSIQILPSLEFIKLSARSTDQSFTEGRKDWFIPTQNLIQFIFPDFFGNPTTYNYWGIWNYAEFIGYIGIVPLFFTLYSLFYKRNRFFVGLLLVSFTLALENPVSKIPYLLKLPFLSSSQPSRVILLIIFAMCTLSAFGIEAFLKNERKKILAPLITLIFTFALTFGATILFSSAFPIILNLNPQKIALHNLILPNIILITFIGILFLYSLKFFKKLVIVLILVITIFDLFRFAQKFAPFSPSSMIFPETDVTSFLQNQERPFRVLTTDRRILNGNSSSPYQIEMVQGYDPIYLKDYAQLVSSWESNSTAVAGSFNRIVTPQNYNSHIADLLNVKYILTFDELNEPKLQKVFQKGDTKIYENKEVLPRAFFTKEVIHTQSKDDELKSILAGKDFKSTSFSSEFSFQSAGSSEQVKFINYSDQEFSLETQTDKTAPLAISNIFYPGWRAYIDGRESKINKINYVLESVLIPSGHHIVKFKFKPASFYNGLYLSGLGVFLTLLSSIYLWRKKYL